MDPKELKEIDKFLTLTGAADLFACMGSRRPRTRTWRISRSRIGASGAQTQQANPKYRNEALCHPQLGHRPEGARAGTAAYRAHTSKRSLEPWLRQPEDFIQGVLSGGGPTPKATDAIRKKGQASGVPPEALTQRLDALEARGREIAEQDEERTEDLAPPTVEVDDDPSSTACRSPRERDSFNEMPDFLAKDQSPEDELKDIVRGLRLQGMMRRRRARGDGLPAR
jgi:hypothetical protein